MKDIEIVVFNDKSWVRLVEYQKLDEELKNEKYLNAEIKKRLIEVEYDCEEFNHEYCDPNCNGKRKETIDLLQLISDGLNETLLKQKDEEIKQLKSELESYQILAYKRGEAYLASLEDEQNLQKENEKLKEQFETDLEYAKAIIKDLLNNSHEYAKQNAEDFIKGEKK